jgi:hypothetical protein
LHIFILGYFVLAEMIICTVCLVIAIAIMEMHYRAMRSLNTPPRWLTTILILQASTEQSFVEPIKINENTGSSSRMYLPWKTLNTPDSLDIRSTMTELNRTVHDIRTLVERKEHEEELVDEWTAIFDRIDSILFVVFQIGNAVVFGLFGVK